MTSLFIRLFVHTLNKFIAMIHFLYTTYINWLTSSSHLFLKERNRNYRRHHENNTSYSIPKNYCVTRPVESYNYSNLALYIVFV
jgi:hypothetical protein